MTIVEIAHLSNVARSTVQGWIAKVSLAEIRQAISEKNESARASSKPADFSLDEVIAIIDAGGNQTLAALLRENAQAKDISEIVSLRGDIRAVIRQEFLRLSRDLLATLSPREEKYVPKNLPRYPSQQIPKKPYIEVEYFTIKAWFAQTGRHIEHSEIGTEMWRPCISESHRLGKEVIKVDDPTYGVLNSYHRSVLMSVFGRGDQ